MVVGCVAIGVSAVLCLALGACGASFSEPAVTDASILADVPAVDVAHDNTIFLPTPDGGDASDAGSAPDAPDNDSTLSDAAGGADAPGVDSALDDAAAGGDAIVPREATAGDGACVAPLSLDCGGVCVDPTLPSHCGSCANMCTGPDAGSGAPTCASGICGITCSAPTSLACDGACVDPTQPENCGGCGHACAGPIGGTGQATCAAGACGLTCTLPTSLLCGRRCVDPTQTTNCGGCGVECTSLAPICAGGLCTALYATALLPGATQQTVFLLIPGGTALATDADYNNACIAAGFAPGQNSDTTRFAPDCATWFTAAGMLNTVDYYCTDCACFLGEDGEELNLSSIQNFGLPTSTALPVCERGAGD